MIFVNRDLSYDFETYKMLEQSWPGVKGLTGVTLVAPSNKRLPVVGYLPTDLRQRGPAATYPMSVTIATAAKSANGPDSQENVSDPVRILDKPRPQYTEEARALNTEGDVLLDVVFLASGKVAVKRVVTGLGHGLDEKALEAAQAIKFKPARTAGKAVDFPARLRIEFRVPD